MEDIKTLTCAPDDETGFIRIYESFGYYLHSSNEIYNKDTQTKLKSDFFTGDLMQTTTENVTHYVKMVFRRNPSIPNYDRLKELEEQFDNCVHPGDEPKGWNMAAILTGFLFYIIPGVLMIIWNRTKVEERKQEYKKAYDAYVAKRTLILEEAAKLVEKDNKNVRKDD